MTNEEMEEMEEAEEINLDKLEQIIKDEFETYTPRELASMLKKGYLEKNLGFDYQGLETKKTIIRTYLKYAPDKDKDEFRRSLKEEFGQYFEESNNNSDEFHIEMFY